MYCSSCGNGVTSGLRYCNHCGAKATEEGRDQVAKPPELFADSLIWAIVTVFIVGLGCNIGLIAVLKEMLNLNAAMIAAFALLVFAMMFALEGVFIWMLLSRRKAAALDGETGRPKGQVTKELIDGPVRALSEPVASVTEQSTRSFEPIYRGRKSE